MSYLTAETRREFAARLLKTHGRVTNGMVVAIDPYRLHTFRNGVSDAKMELAAAGWDVVFEHGETFAENAWTLKKRGELF